MNNATVISANKELTFQEVKFLNHLRSLSTAKGYCWAGNEYFARYYGVSERTIRRWLNKLKKLGYITREFAFKGKLQRWVRICQINNTQESKNYTAKNISCMSGYMSGYVRPETAQQMTVTMPKKEADLYNIKELKYNKDIYINSVFPMEKHNTRTSERKNYIAPKKFDDKKRTPDGVLRVIKKIVNVLNETASVRFRHTTKQTMRLIIARLREGFKFEDFVKVITTKCKEWLGTPFAKYLRPKTLFSTNHFEDYLNQHDQKSRVDSSCNQKVIQAPRKNKFANFAQREWDFARIEYLSLLDDDEQYTEEGMAEYRKYYETQEKWEAEQPRPTKFHNFAGREWDFALIEKLAQED